ncbi:MAG TPA: hypothetical protein PKK43_08235, partial [Spirochaetota bacterium]|nr:hypothetical protein [Spirochaetota bacterium]
KKILPYIAGTAALACAVAGVRYALAGEIARIVVAVPVAAAVYFGILFAFREELAMMIFSHGKGVLRRFRRSDS